MTTKFAKRLDKSRPFGTYHPPDDGAFHVQDGFDFDHEGYIVESHLKPEQREQLAKKQPKPAAAAKPPKPAAKPATPPQEDDGEGGGGDDTADELNLEAWLRGEEDYPFPAVQKAVKARLSTWKTGRRDLVMFLVEDQKLVEYEVLSDEFKNLIGPKD